MGFSGSSKGKVSLSIQSFLPVAFFDCEHFVVTLSIYSFRRMESMFSVSSLAWNWVGDERRIESLSL